MMFLFGDDQGRAGIVPTMGGIASATATAGWDTDRHSKTLTDMGLALAAIDRPSKTLGRLGLDAAATKARNRFLFGDDQGRAGVVPTMGRIAAATATAGWDTDRHSKTLTNMGVAPAASDSHSHSHSHSKTLASIGIAASDNHVKLLASPGLDAASAMARSRGVVDALGAFGSIDRPSKTLARLGLDAAAIKARNRFLSGDEMRSRGVLDAMSPRGAIDSHGKTLASLALDAAATKAGNRLLFGGDQGRAAIVPTMSGIAAATTAVGWDTDRHSKTLGSLGLDAASAMTRSRGVLGAMGALRASDSHSEMLASLGLDAAATNAGTRFLFGDDMRASSVLDSMGALGSMGALDENDLAAAGELDGWQETKVGLWVPDPAQLIAMTVTAYVALTVIGLYLQEMNRLGEGVADVNRVELFLSVLGWLGLQWGGHRWMVARLRQWDDPDGC